MKKLVLYAAFLYLLPASAQQQTATNPKQSHLTSEQRVDKQLNKMKQELNLTDAQVPQVKQLLVERENMREAKAGTANPEAAKETHKQMMNDLHKILTPEQMAKLKQMQAEQKQKKQSKTSSPSNMEPAK